MRPQMTSERRWTIGSVTIAVIGVLLLCLNTVGLVINSNKAQVYSGFWGGGMFVGLAIYSWGCRKKTFRTFNNLNGLLLYGVFCVAAGFAICVLHAIAADCDARYDCHMMEDDSLRTLRVAVNATMSIIGGLSGIVCIVICVMATWGRLRPHVSDDSDNVYNTYPTQTQNVFSMDTMSLPTNTADSPPAYVLTAPPSYYSVVSQAGALGPENPPPYGLRRGSRTSMAGQNGGEPIGGNHVGNPGGLPSYGEVTSSFDTADGRVETGLSPVARAHFVTSSSVSASEGRIRSASFTVGDEDADPWCDQGSASSSRKASSDDAGGAHGISPGVTGQSAPQILDREPRISTDDEPGYSGGTSPGALGEPACNNGCGVIGPGPSHSKGKDNTQEAMPGVRSIHVQSAQGDTSSASSPESVKHYPEPAPASAETHEQPGQSSNSQHVSPHRTQESKTKEAHSQDDQILQAREQSQLRAKCTQRNTHSPGDREQEQGHPEPHGGIFFAQKTKLLGVNDRQPGAQVNPAGPSPDEPDS